MQKKRILRLLRDVQEEAGMQWVGIAEVQTKGKEPFYHDGDTIRWVTRLWWNTRLLAPLAEAIELIENS